MHSLDLGAGRLSYALFGRPDAAGATLLVHGYAGDRLSWAGLAPRLAARSFVVAPDLPAHGETSLAADDVEVLHEPLVALLGDLDVEPSRLHVVGLSMGAVVATRLAEVLADGGCAPRALTLVAAAGLGREVDVPFIEAMAAGPSVGALSHLLRRIAVRVPELSEEIKHLAAARLAEGRLAGLSRSLASPHGQRLDIVPALARLAHELPVRLAVGLRDEIIPWTHALNVSPRVAVHLFADAGHMVHWDAQETLAELIEAA